MAISEPIRQLTITGPQGSFTHFLAPGATTLGRQAGNTLLLESTLVSRSHARVDSTPQGCQITDLGSSNGTYLNGEKLAPSVPVPLVDGALVKIGPFEIRFSETVAPPEVEPQPAIVESHPAEPQTGPEMILAPQPADGDGRASSEPGASQPSPDPLDPAAGLTVDLPTGELPLDDRTPPPPVPRTSAILSTNGRHPPDGMVPPGLSIYSQRLAGYLPGIYQTDFMQRFLGIFEAILFPIEWDIDNFDLYLDPATSPAGFLPWLANWFGMLFDPTWNEAQQRLLLKEAHQIYARRGTRWALSRLLEIYTGLHPEIDDQGKDLHPFTFRVKLPCRESEVDRALIERLINSHKPAYTAYILEFKG